jgi:hypothetical protein
MGDFRLISDASSGPENRVRRNFKHAVSLQTDPRDAERAHMFFDVNHNFVAVKEDQVQGE